MTTPSANPAAAPFATADEVAAGWRVLSDQDRINAELLLSAVALWIRDRLPDIEPDNPAAKYVSIDVVRNAMDAGANRGMSSFSKTIGPWSKSGTLVNPSGAISFTTFHKQLLGLAGRVQGPLFHFEENDY